RRARHGGAGGRRRRSGDCSGFRTWPSRSQMPTGPVRDTRGLAGPSEGRLAVLQRKRREGRGRCALLSTYGRGAAAAVDVSGLAGSPLTPTLSRKGRGGKRHRPLSPRGRGRGPSRERWEDEGAGTDRPPREGRGTYESRQSRQHRGPPAHGETAAAAPVLRFHRGR